jgi:type IV pilus assembly protein PilQ
VKLSDITVDAKTDTTVQIKTTGAARYHANLIGSPSRLVIDLEDTVYAWRPTPLTVGGDLVKQVRGSQYRKNVARVVIEFTRKSEYKIVESGAGLIVTVSAAAPGPAPTAAAKPTIAAAMAKPEPALGAPAVAAAAKAVTAVPAAKPTPAPPVPAAKASAPAKEKPAAKKPAAAPTATPAPKLEVAKTETPAPVVPAPTPAPAPLAPGNGSRLISLDFKDADVVNLLRILAAESGQNIVIGDDVKGKMSITLRNVPWQVALDTILEVRGLQKIESDNLIRIVSHEQLAREREARTRIEEAKRKAEAEIRQKEAEAKAAEHRAAADETARQEALARGPLREETIRLSYADPADVAATLQGILGLPPGGIQASPLTPPSGPPPIVEPPFSALYGPPAPPPPAPSPSAEVLSRGITIQAHRPTNSIFIRHYEQDLGRIKKLIRETLDIPLPQVKIEARLESLDRNALENIGVTWGGAASGGANNVQLVGQGMTSATAISNTGAISGPSSGLAFPASSIVGNPGLTLSQLLPVAAATGLPTGGSLVNLPISGLPATGASLNSPTAGFSFGIIGTRFNVNLALQALAEQQKTRTIARPEVVTVENNKATIQLGREIPYATVSSAGTQVQFRDAVLQLQVTPVVIIEGNVKKVKLTVLVENNEQGADTGAGPTIVKRRAETQVLVKEGEHLVIGGVGTATDQKTIRKVPVFGDIPVLGWLFKQKGDRETSSELVVFITPTVLKSEQVAVKPVPTR